MERLKKSYFFWLLLLVSVVVPSIANAQTTQRKKMSWTAVISVNGEPVGTAIINHIRIYTFNPATSTFVLTSDEVNYRVRTVDYPCASAPAPCQPGEILVTKATLRGPGAGTPWERVLCENLTCGYQEDGNLDAEGVLATPLPQGFFLNLPFNFGVQGAAEVLLNDGTLGQAYFYRFF
jgi:hypothetical protein